MLGKKGRANNSNQFIRAKQTGEPYVFQEKTREQLRAAGRLANDIRWAKPDAHKRQSETMRRVARENPESYSVGNLTRVRRYEYQGEQFVGSWELDFYKWCESQGILCQRNRQGFPYEWQGQRTYYPDFYIPSLALYVEVKGWESERDHAKWLAFPHPLMVIREKEIREIRQCTFTGLDQIPR